MSSRTVLWALCLLLAPSWGFSASWKTADAWVLRQDRAGEYSVLPPGSGSGVATSTLPTPSAGPGGATRLTGSALLDLGGGRNLPATIQRDIPWASVRSALASRLGTAAAVVSAFELGYGIGEWLNENYIYKVGTEVKLAGPTPKEEQVCWSVPNSAISANCYTSPGNAIQGYVGWLNSSNTNDFESANVRYKEQFGALPCTITAAGNCSYTRTNTQNDERISGVWTSKALINYPNEQKTVGKSTALACPEGGVRYIGPGPCTTKEEDLVPWSPTAIESLPAPVATDLPPKIWPYAVGAPNGVPDPSPGLPEVTGPASVPGATTTTEGPSGTTTQTTVHNITYNGNVITVNNTTTTAGPGGTTTETSEPDAQITAPSDTALPPVPKLYERKYPNGLSGVWDSKSAELQASPIFAFLAGLVPGTGDGGCPVWTMPIMYGIGNYSTADISVPCWVWAAVRLVMICSALLLCRRLIFGG